MPVISFVTGNIYLIFGSYKMFKTLGFSTQDALFLSGILLILSGIQTFLVARSNSQQLICPKEFALKMVFFHFSMAAVMIPIMMFSCVTPSFATKTFTFFLFAVFSFFLANGPAYFPTFSVSDPFYWEQNRLISPLYDRAIKAVILAAIPYFLAPLSALWHTLITIFVILCDVVLIAQYWEISGLENLRIADDDEIPMEPMEPVVEDLHMD